MATRSTISIINLDNTVSQIYCHNDGYYENNGIQLLLFYDDVEKVKELISLGSLSSLHRNINPMGSSDHSFDKPQSGVTVAYHRDRGEDKQIGEFKTLEDFISNGDFQGYDYVFKEKNKKWYILKDDKLKVLFSTIKSAKLNDYDYGYTKDFKIYEENKRIESEYTKLNNSLEQKESIQKIKTKV